MVAVGFISIAGGCGSFPSSPSSVPGCSSFGSSAAGIGAAGSSAAGVGATASSVGVAG